MLKLRLIITSGFVLDKGAVLMITCTFGSNQQSSSVMST